VDEYVGLLLTDQQ